jgi:hypothetical protein
MDGEQERGLSRAEPATYEDCRRCGAFCVSTFHVCPPRHVVWCPEAGETEEDGQSFRAHSARAAAERWAEWSDRHSADYGIVRGASVIVHVRQDGCEEMESFTVTGEMVPCYTAHPSEP